MIIINDYNNITIIYGNQPYFFVEENGISFLEENGTLHVLIHNICI